MRIIEIYNKLLTNFRFYLLILLNNNCVKIRYIFKLNTFSLLIYESQRGAPAAVGNFSALSNSSVVAQNVSCLDFVAEMFARKVMLNMGWVILIFSC